MRLDKSVFKIKTFKEADDNRSYWMSVSPKERLAAAWYLICSAYNIEHHGYHKLDKSKFSIRKHNE